MTARRLPAGWTPPRYLDVGQQSLPIRLDAAPRRPTFAADDDGRVYSARVWIREDATP